MKRLINLLRGRVTVRVTGAYPERLINLCAVHAVAFWGVEWLDETSFRFTVALWDWKKLKELAGRSMCELDAIRMDGLPAAALRMKKRWAFWAGLALFALTLLIIPNFILAVEVTGNQQVPDAVILSELRRLGVKFGAYAPGLEEKAIANRALLELEELSFLAVNVSGCKAVVTVREADPAPELLAEDVPAHIVAAADGIVLDVQTTAGQALVQEGDVVAKGDILISGVVDFAERTEAETDLGTSVVHAVGTVTARTWRTMTASIPLTAEVKELTGASQTFFSLNFLGKRLNFYQNSSISYARYDKITSTSVLTLPGGAALPISLTRETVREYGLTEAELDLDAAISLLEDGLRRGLDEILQETDGELVRLDYTAVVEDGTLTVTMLAECVEQIGKTIAWEGETGFTPGVSDFDP